MKLVEIRKRKLMMVRYGDVNLVTNYGKEMMRMEVGGFCVMGATESTISSSV